MDGVQGMETDYRTQEEEDVQSPVKKRSGSSKTASWRRGNCLVSPTKQGSIPQAAPWATSYLDTFIHTYSQVILELAVTLKSDKAFKEFTQALMSFITNAQMVGPKFVINPLNPHSKEKNISSKGEISPNMTKLGTYI